MLNLNFKTPAEFDAGIERLSDILGFCRGDGITVTAEKGERIGVTLDGASAVIYYREKCQFFRELGILCENAAGGSFDINEDTFFNELSAMIDVSQNAVYKLDTVKGIIDRLALMGYGMMMLYTEDQMSLENYKYFGYMRARYTKDELREIDDYAYTYGIEVIPCIECYGHMGHYLFWSEAALMRDTTTVLMAREEATFKFVEEMIKTASECFRSRRIHIGMDEANDMGRGKFLDKYGYVPAIDIFNEYMGRLCSITDKYGLKPMMWVDMYFRSSDKLGRYYSKDCVISDETKSKIPKNMELVMWHYGEAPGCDEYMLKKCVELDRNIIYAGATWSWSGHFPHHDKMMESCTESIAACRKVGVRDVMQTVWNSECPVVTNLLGFSYMAELVYRGELSQSEFRARFEACTGADFDGFYELRKFYDTCEGNENYSDYEESFRGKPLFWQDVLEGLYDVQLYEKPMSEHYVRCAEKMRAFNGDAYSDVYPFAELVFKYLAAKCEVGEKIAPAYKAGARKELERLLNEVLPQLKEQTEALHREHKKIWHKYNKSMGWSVFDLRYGGLRARIDTAIETLTDYLDGKLDVIEQLEEPRLKKNMYVFTPMNQIVGPNI